MKQNPNKKITFWLKWFPEFCRYKSQRLFMDLGQTEDKWFPSRSINIEEKEWEGFARIKIFLILLWQIKVITRFWDPQVNFLRL